jgi:hypothetical protein
MLLVWHLQVPQRTVSRFRSLILVNGALPSWWFYPLLRIGRGKFPRSVHVYYSRWTHQHNLRYSKDGYFHFRCCSEAKCVPKYKELKIPSFHKWRLRSWLLFKFPNIGRYGVVSLSFRNCDIYISQWALKTLDCSNAQTHSLSCAKTRILKMSNLVF